MAYMRRRSFDNDTPKLLDLDMKTRYWERKFKEYLEADDEDESQNNNHGEYKISLTVFCPWEMLFKRFSLWNTA